MIGTEIAVGCADDWAFGCLVVGGTEVGLIVGCGDGSWDGV